MSKESTLSHKLVGTWLTILGSLGMLASVTLLHDVIELAKNPSFVPICSINPILSCTSVMASAQAEVFGIPNPVFGVIAFTMLITFGILLTAKTTFTRWIWGAALAAGVMGVIFAHWLFFQSMFALGTICPWCSLVWVITIAIFWLLVSYVLDHELFGTTKKLTVMRSIWRRYRTAVLIAWYLLLIAIVFVRFNDYWMSLL